MEQIKRVNIGSYVRTVSGKCGIITGSDKENVFFTAQDGEETKVYRGAAFKCTRKEYEAAVAKHKQELAAKAEQEAKEQKARAKPAPKTLAEALEADDRALAEEDAEDDLQGEDLDLTPEDADEAQGEGHGDADEDIEDEDEDAAAPGSIVKSEYKARYLNTRSHSGSSSKICGDAISTMMNGQTVERCAEIVAGYTGDSAADLLSRYEHLNPGQRRMNIGNRLRHWAKNNAPELLIKPGQEEDEE